MPSIDGRVHHIFDDRAHARGEGLYNFLSGKIKPSLHLGTVIKDKTILLYAMTKGLQFDIGMVTEWGLIESTHGCCTSALIHPLPNH